MSIRVEETNKLIAGRKTVGLDSAFSFAPNNTLVPNNTKQPYAPSFASKQFGPQPTAFELKTIKSNTFHNVFINSVSVKEFVQLVKYALENLNHDSRRTRQASYAETKARKNSQMLDRFRYSEQSNNREHLKLEQ